MSLDMAHNTTYTFKTLSVTCKKLCHATHVKERSKTTIKMTTNMHVFVLMIFKTTIYE